MHFKTHCVNMFKNISFSLPGANSAFASISSLEYQPNVPDSHGCHHKPGNHPYQGFHRSGITTVKTSFVLSPSFEYQPQAPDTHGWVPSQAWHPPSLSLLKIHVLLLLMSIGVFSLVSSFEYMSHRTDLHSCH
jgi:hypothetical protein